MRYSLALARGVATGRTSTGRQAVLRVVPTAERLEGRVLLAVSPAGPEFLVNPPSDGFDGTTRQSVATDADGDSVVVWDTAEGTYARRYDAAGGVVGDAFPVSAGAGGARVAMGSRGEFVVVSSRGSAGGSGIDILGRRYDAAGTPQGEEFLVSDQTRRLRQSYSVAMNGAGDFVIAWSSPDLNGVNHQVHAHRYDRSGSSQGGPFLVEAAPYDEYVASPAVAVGAGGDFVIAWAGSSRPPPEGRQRIDVYARRYSADGEPQGEKFVVNPQPDNAGSPSVAMEDDGEFVISYHGSGVQFRRYSAAGAELGEPVVLGHEDMRITPSFTAQGDVRSFVGVWERTIRSGPTRPDFDVDVYARCFDESGGPLGGEFVVNTTTAWRQDTPSVAVDGEGDLIFAWTLWDAQWTTSDVYARRYAAGTPVPSIAGRHVFYNHSSFDGDDASASPADDNAIATNKSPLLPGQAASFLNVTSYTRGINGVMVDIADLPAGTSLTVDDFEIGGNGTRPLSVDVRRGAGVNGSDRVTLTWPDYNPLTDPPTMAVANGWLRVTVKANTNTGLAVPDVFSFGNLIGETGDAGSPMRVTTLDMLLTRRNLFTAAPVASRYDFNRDGRVSPADYGITRASQRHGLPGPPADAALRAPVPLRPWDEAVPDPLA